MSRPIVCARCAKAGVEHYHLPVGWIVLDKSDHRFDVLDEIVICNTCATAFEAWLKPPAAPDVVFDHDCVNWDRGRL